MSATLKLWLHGLAATTIGGAATALANVAITPQIVGSVEGLRQLGLTSLAGGLLNAIAYLMKSPAPPADGPPDASGQSPGPRKP